MSTDVDTPVSRPARRGRYVLLAVLLVVALGALFGLNRAGVFGDDSPAGAAGQPDGFEAQLSAKTVNALENLPVEDHGHGDHDTDVSKSKMVCGVRIFGRNPANADTVDEVAQVYGYHMCAFAEPGKDWILAPKLTGPAVITLAGDPPTMTVAEGGEGFRDRVDKLFPEQHRAEALNENLTPEGMEELIRRYNEAAKA